MKKFLIAVSLILIFMGCAENDDVSLITAGCEADGLDVTISRVIDGDTIEYMCNGIKYKVRIIGIDSPETKDPKKPKQCFGKEAEKNMKYLENNRKVKLFIGNENKDKYGRLLRYVYRNNKDIGVIMLENGFAFAYKKFDHEKIEEYVRLEKNAKNKKLGLWNKKNCNY